MVKYVRSQKSIDDTDYVILRYLRDNGRISNNKLARLIGLSNSACLERVRKLERSGIIAGYYARIAWEFEARPFQLWANIAVLDLPSATQESCMKVVGACCHIVAAYQLSGTLDCLVQFAADDASAWRAFCSELAAIGIGPERVRFGLVVGPAGL